MFHVSSGQVCMSGNLHEPCTVNWNCVLCLMFQIKYSGICLCSPVEYPIWLQLVSKDDQYRELQQQMNLTRDSLQKDLDQVMLMQNKALLIVV